MMGYARKAYGAQRRTSAMQRATYVAESIAAHGLDTEHPDTWRRYGLQAHPEQRALVRAALATQTPREERATMEGHLATMLFEHLANLAGTLTALTAELHDHNELMEQVVEHAGRIADALECYDLDLDPEVLAEGQPAATGPQGNPDYTPEVHRLVEDC